MTGQQIEDEIYGLLRDSSLSRSINGNVYKYGLRPKDSQREDIVVKFVAGTAEQIQKGRVSVNIFIPDKPRPAGPPVRDIKRCRELEDAAVSWIDELIESNPQYMFKLSQTISTFQEEEINQHFVSLRIEYEFMEIKKE